MDETPQAEMEGLRQEMQSMRDELRRQLDTLTDDRPITLTTEQFAHLSRRTGGGGGFLDTNEDIMDVDYDPGVDPVLTSRQPPARPPTVIKLHDNPPPKGAKDIKGAKYPPPFAGNQEDARPFIRRLEAYWSLTPKASRLSRTRILITCQLITTEPATLWASSVTESITLFTDNEYYFYDWDSFKTTFIGSFGVPNEEAHAMNLLSHKTQGHSDLIPFITEFERLQRDAKITDDTALFFFKKNISARLYNEICRARPVPTTLEGWKKEALTVDKNFQIAQDFKYNQRNDKYPAKSSKSYSSFIFRPTSTHIPHGGTLLSSSHDSDAMQVDALNHKRKKGKGKDKKPSSKTKPVKAPLPAPKRPALPPAYPNKGKVVMADARCHRCGLKGHFMRDCVTRMNQLTDEHIRQLAEFALHRDIPEEEVSDSEDSEEEDTETEETVTNTETDALSQEQDFQKD